MSPPMKWFPWLPYLKLHSSQWHPFLPDPKGPFHSTYLLGLFTGFIALHIHTLSRHVLHMAFSLFFTIYPLFYSSLLACVCVCILSRSVMPHSLRLSTHTRTLWPPGSSFPGILQAGILEWVALPSSRGSSQPRDRTHVSLRLLHWQVGSLPLAPSGKPSKLLSTDQRTEPDHPEMH